MILYLIRNIDVRDHGSYVTHVLHTKGKINDPDYNKLRDSVINTYIFNFNITFLVTTH